MSPFLTPPPPLVCSLVPIPLFLTLCLSAQTPWATPHFFPIDLETFPSLPFFPETPGYPVPVRNSTRVVQQPSILAHHSSNFYSIQHNMVARRQCLFAHPHSLCVFTSGVLAELESELRFTTGHPFLLFPQYVCLESCPWYEIFLSSVIKGELLTPNCFGN